MFIVTILHLQVTVTLSGIAIISNISKSVPAYTHELCVPVISQLSRLKIQPAFLWSRRPWCAQFPHCDNSAAFPSYDHHSETPFLLHFEFSLYIETCLLQEAKGPSFFLMLYCRIGSIPKTRSYINPLLHCNSNYVISAQLVRDILFYTGQTNLPLSNIWPIDWNLMCL